MSPSDLMRKFVSELFARHHMSPTDNVSSLRHTLEGKDQLLIEEVESNRLWRMAYSMSSSEQEPTIELEIHFFVDDEGQWIPFAICRPQTGPKVYADLDLTASQFNVTDLNNQWALATYCDAWTFYLRQQGWLEKGVVG